MTDLIPTRLQAVSVAVTVRLFAGAARSGLTVTPGCRAVLLKHALLGLPEPCKLICTGQKGLTAVHTGSLGSRV